MLLKSSLIQITVHFQGHKQYRIISNTMMYCWQYNFNNARPRPIMLKILPIMLLSSAQKIAHSAQYYADKILIMPQYKYKI